MTLSIPSLATWQVKLLWYANLTHGKNKRINIRIAAKNLEEIQKKALEEGVPYQTLISSILHKYASGRLAWEIYGSLTQ